MTPSTSTGPSGLHWFPARFLAEFGVWAAALGGGAFAVTMAVAFGIDWWGAGQVDSSYWAGFGSQASRWFALFIGAHLGYSLLPLHIAHGYTRREFAQKGMAFIVAYGAALAVLISVGFLLEAGVYGLRGWPQEIEGSHLFQSAGEVHLILLEYWLALTLWISGGAFLGAAFYRSEKLGMAAICVALLLGLVAEMAIGGFGGPFAWALERLGGPTQLGLGVGLPLHLLCVAALLGLSWLIVRDIPMRSRTT